MDLRVEKTRRAVYNAFLEQRAKKPLEKISVKELCALAQINKSTFYAHYEDIYALSDRLEDQVVESVMENLPCPERIFEDPAGFTRDLFWAYTAQENLIDILFSGSRSGHLIEKIEQSIKALVYERKPEYRNDMEKELMLLYQIYGGYYAFMKTRKKKDFDIGEVIHILGEFVGKWQNSGEEKKSE